MVIIYSVLDLKRSNTGAAKTWFCINTVNNQSESNDNMKETDFPRRIMTYILHVSEILFTDSASPMGKNKAQQLFPFYYSNSCT